MENVLDCPICGKSKFTEFLSCCDYTVSQEVFKIVKCFDCGFVFTNPRPTEGEIGRYYQSEDYISHSNTKKGLVNNIYHRIRLVSIRRKERLIRTLANGKSLLDYGSGGGAFAKFTLSKGWNVKGIEQDDATRERSINEFGLQVFKPLEFEKIVSASIDVVTMWHVLEHVHKIEWLFSQVSRVLTSDGVVVIAVPNYTSYDARKYKKYWAAYDVPRHLYHFSPSTISLLAEKHNFNIVEIHPMKFDSYYVSMLSEKYKGQKLTFLYGMISGFVSNVKSWRKNEYSSQIYILKRNKAI